MNKWKSPLQQAVVGWLTAHPDVTRAEMAQRAGISKSSIVEIANGDKHNLNGDSAVALAAAMGVTVEDLYAGRSKPAAAAAGAPIASDAEGGLVMLSLSALAINPLNPRKAFDAEDLAELAESIAADGVLQNLVVGPAGRDGRHVVIAGGRRQRALMQLAEAGRWAEAAPTIPCRIVAGEEPRVRALALIENLQRVELAPMEEAEAFAELQQLDPALWTTARIAEAVHRTQRFVQQRLAMAVKLTAPAKKALAQGTISVEMARELTKAPMKRQAEIVKGIQQNATNGWNRYTAETVRRLVTDGWIPIERAAFDRALYTGEIVTDDDTGEKWLTDTAQFKKLQLKAAEAKVKELESQRKWVRLTNPDKGSYFSSYGYNTSKAKDLSGTGAVVAIDHDWTIKVHDGLLEKKAETTGRAKTKAAAKKGAEAEKPEPEPYTKSLLIHSKRAKTGPLQDAIVITSQDDDADTAMSLAIIGMLGISDKVKIGEPTYGKEDLRRGATQARRLQKLYAAIAAHAKADKARRGAAADDQDDDIDDDDVDGEAGDEADPEDVRRPSLSPSAAWRWLRAKTRAERVTIFSTLVADRCGFYPGWGADVQPSHDDYDVALAEHVGLDMANLWLPTETWLGGSRKARLEVLARGLRLDPIPKSTTQLRAAIAERIADAERPGGTPLPPAGEWMPPEMRVLDDAGFKAAFVPFKQVPEAEAAAAKKRKAGGKDAQPAAA